MTIKFKIDSLEDIENLTISYKEIEDYISENIDDSYLQEQFFSHIKSVGVFNFYLFDEAMYEEQESEFGDEEKEDSNSYASKSAIGEAVWLNNDVYVSQSGAEYWEATSDTKPDPNRLMYQMVVDILSELNRQIKQLKH